MLGLGGLQLADRGHRQRIEDDGRIGELAERLGEVCFLRIETKGRGYACGRPDETGPLFAVHGCEPFDRSGRGRPGNRVVAARGRYRDRLAVGPGFADHALLEARDPFSRLQPAHSLDARHADLRRCPMRFKAIRVESVRPLLPLVVNQHWFFDTELLVLAEYPGLAVRTLPIVWIEYRQPRTHSPHDLGRRQGSRRLRHTARGRALEGGGTGQYSALRGRKGAAIRNGTGLILFPFFWRTNPAASGSTSGQRTGVTSGKLGRKRGLEQLPLECSCKPIRYGGSPASVRGGGGGAFCPVTVPICPVTVPICPVTVRICPVISPRYCHPSSCQHRPAAFCQKKIQN